MDRYESDIKESVRTIVKKETEKYRNRELSRIVFVFDRFLGTQFCDLGQALVSFYSAFSGKKPGKRITLIASVLEIYKSYLHIFDDVIDNDKTREGQPSFHILLQRELDVPEHKAKNSSQLFSLMLKDICIKYFKALSLDDLFRPADMGVLVGQLREEFEQPNSNFEDLYRLKTNFVALPVIIASRLCDIKVKEETLGRFIITDQRINDLYDLVHKKTDVRTYANTPLMFAFGENSPDKIEKFLKERRYSDILKKEIDTISASLSILREYFLGISRDSAPIESFYRELGEYLSEIRRGLDAYIRK